jgi:CheY-like chemotaxis protein
MAASADTVLVVDDDPEIRAALAELLETEGYEVVLAANGAAAMAHLRRGLRPCLILLDLMMPVMDGWDFRAEQRCDPELQDIPVAIITAAGFSSETVSAQLGGIDFVSKPPSTDALLALVRRHCKKKGG